MFELISRQVGSLPSSHLLNPESSWCQVVPDGFFEPFVQRVVDPLESEPRPQADITLRMVPALKRHQFQRLVHVRKFRVFVLLIV